VLAKVCGAKNKVKLVDLLYKAYIECVHTFWRVLVRLLGQRDGCERWTGKKFLACCCLFLKSMTSLITNISRTLSRTPRNNNIADGEFDRILSPLAPFYVVYTFLNFIDQKLVCAQMLTVLNGSNHCMSHVTTRSTISMRSSEWTVT